MPDQGSNPVPLHWECRVLATEPPGKSLTFFFLIFIFYYYYYFLINLFIFVCTGCLLLCAWAFSSCGEGGLLFASVRGLLIAVASLVAEHGL